MSDPMPKFKPEDVVRNRKTQEKGRVVRCEPILLFEFESASRGDQQPSDGTRCPKLLVAVVCLAQRKEQSRDEFHHRVLSH